MPLTNYGLDQLVSQHLSKLHEPVFRSFVDEFPGRGAWFDDFTRARLFRNHIPPENVPMALLVLRRADAAIEAWERARAAAEEDLRNPRMYFTLLQHVEHCIAALYQGLDCGRKALNRPMFETGDGSVYARLNLLYNGGRHYLPGQLPPGALHKLWLSDTAVHSDEAAVSLEELRDQVSMLGRIAQAIVTGPPPRPDVSGQ